MDPAHHPSPELIEAVALGRDISPDLRRHIETCPECSPQLAQFRANNEFLVDLLVAVVPRRAAEAERPAESVPGYRILEPISAGGQGMVYKAVQERTGRTVALKMLAGGWFATEKQRRRFEREIDIAASLRHPNIATVYDAVELRTGLHAFAMEYIDGVPLDRWEPATVEFIEPFPQPAPRREVPQEERYARAMIAAKLGVFAKVCDAVHHAHQRGIIHRDLKPSNILADTLGEPHVLDFGIAVFAGEQEGGRVTQSGEFTGTVEFASPEQAGGEPTGIDFRTDIYSLGVILYASLTGAMPYAMQGQTLERLRIIQHEPPRRPGLLHPALRGDIEVIILKALDKDRARRYQTAAEFAADIRHFLAREPIAARRDSVLYVLGKRASRHRGKLAVAAVVGVSLAVALGFYLRERAAWREREAQAKSALLLKDAEAARELTHKEQQSIARMGAIISGAFGAGGRTLSDAEVQRLKESAALLELKIDDARADLSPTAYAEMRIALAGIYRDARLFREANFQLTAAERVAASLDDGADLRARAAAIRATMTAPTPPSDSGPDLLRHALALLDRDEGEAALRAANESAGAFRGANPADETSALRAEDLAARALLRLNRAAEAEQAATAVVEALRGLPGATTVEESAWTTVAEARLAQGNDAGVWAALTNALVAFLRRSDLLPGASEALTPLTAYPIESPREEVREPARRHGPQIATATIGILRANERGATLDVAERYFQIAAEIGAAFDAALAIPFATAAVAAYNAELANDDPRAVEALWRAGRIYADGNDPDSAIRAMEEAMRRVPASLRGTYPTDYFPHVVVLSTAYASLDRWIDIANVRRADVARREADPRADSLELTDGHLAIARAGTFGGQFDEAATELEKAQALVARRTESAESACLKCRLAHERALLLAFQEKGEEALAALAAETATCDGERSLALAFGPGLRAIEGVARAAAGQHARADQAFADSLPKLMTSNQSAMHRPLIRRAAAMYEAWGRPARAAELRAWLAEHSSP